jgi:hypothetical protein
VQELHVAGVRRIAVENLRRPADAAHDFRQRRILEIGQPGSRLIVLEMLQ